MFQWLYFGIPKSSYSVLDNLTQLLKSGFCSLLNFTTTHSALYFLIFSIIFFPKFGATQTKSFI